jgi:phosphoadenosine phosphosulfate reductase
MHTVPEIPLEIFWCAHCRVPVIKYANALDKDICPACGGAISYLCADLRPVFPEERLLFDITRV